MTGDASKRRLFAAAVDLLLAMLCGLILGRLMPPANEVAIWIAAVVVFLGYYLVSEALFAATPGKALFGLRVCTLSGGRPSFLSILVRTLLRVIEVNPILAGGLPAGLVIMATKSRQRLGGKLSKTLVVRRESLATKIESNA